jgi:hypothetical protein
MYSPKLSQPINRLQAGVLLSGGARDFSVLHSIQIGFRAQPSSYLVNAICYFPRCKEAEVRSWAVTSI